MFNSKKLNKKINKLYERVLELACDHYNWALETLLSKDNTFSMHQQNIHCTMVKIKLKLLKLS